jgi:hypothetical protein
LTTATAAATWPLGGGCVCTNAGAVAVRVAFGGVVVVVVCVGAGATVVVVGALVAGGDVGTGATVLAWLEEPQALTPTAVVAPSTSVGTRSRSFIARTLFVDRDRPPSDPPPAASDLDGAQRSACAKDARR